MILKCILIRSLYYIFWVWEGFYFFVRFREQSIVSRLAQPEALITLLLSNPACFPGYALSIVHPSTPPCPSRALRLCGEGTAWCPPHANCHLQVLSPVC